MWVLDLEAWICVLRVPIDVWKLQRGSERVQGVKRYLMDMKRLLNM